MSMNSFKTIPELFRPQLHNTRMRFQVANREVLPSMGVAHVMICMYGYTFNLPIFVCDMRDINCIIGLDAGTMSGFITCQQTSRLWFSSNQCDEPKQLSSSYSNAICHLLAVQRVELKLFKTCTIEIAYAKRAMSKKWDGSQVLCTTHSSLWVDLGAIMMDGVADLSPGSGVLEFVNSTSYPVFIKPGQIVATAIQVDSVEVLLDSKPHDDKSISSPEPVFSCVKRKDKFLYTSNGSRRKQV